MKGATVLGAVLLLAVFGYVSYSQTKPPGPNDWVYCDSAHEQMTELACEAHNAVAAKTNEKQQAALPKGCALGFYYDQPIYCKDKRDYEWNTDVWVETEDSKVCVPFYDRKVSDMPLRCLDYFHLAKP